ncbi:MAG: energy transducer TonB [Saprospiraceae bacterium]|nr:energy transducer TonB [Saprospiraceae bacterium]
MKKELKDKHFLGKPVYSGGTKSMQNFLRDNKVYPKEALDLGIEGTVSIRYTIDYKGKVIQVKILSGIGHGCDEEAERIVRLLKFEVPKTRKIKVQYQKTVHIHFRKPEQIEIIQNIQYTISKPGDKKTSKNAKPSYTYQIQW